MSDCIFCKIVEGEIPADKVKENERFIAFNDIGPKAPTHILVIPKEHVRSHAEAEDDAMLGQLLGFARDLVHEKDLVDSGYRLVINTNEEGGQEVFHLHLHILAGRPMRWPPG